MDALLIPWNQENGYVFLSFCLIFEVSDKGEKRGGQFSDHYACLASTTMVPSSDANDVRFPNSSPDTSINIDVLEGRIPSVNATLSFVISSMESVRSGVCSQGVSG